MDRWWPHAAVVLATGVAFVAITTFVESDDPMYQRVLTTAVLLGAAGLAIAGVAIRPRNRRLGAMLAAIGTLPAVAPIVLFWFPPALVIGLVASAVIVKATQDAQTQPVS
jgi:hypothetical protein